MRKPVELADKKEQMKQRWNLLVAESLCIGRWLCSGEWRIIPDLFVPLPHLCCVLQDNPVLFLLTFLLVVA